MIPFENVYHINGLVRKRRISIANALELRLSCTRPSISTSACWWLTFFYLLNTSTNPLNFCPFMRFAVNLITPDIRIHNFLQKCIFCVVFKILHFDFWINSCSWLNVLQPIYIYIYYIYIIYNWKKILNIHFVCTTLSHILCCCW